MLQLTLEQRVAALEKQVAAITAQNSSGTNEKPWLRTMGIFAGNDAMKEIFDEALKLREKDRRKARRLQGKKPVSKRAK